MGHGGKRPGAGMPKGTKLKPTLEKEAAREFVRKMITANLQPIIEAQLANAAGLKYLVTRNKKTGKFVRVTEAMAKLERGDDEETIEVWEKDPNIQAASELMNRALDKPKEQPQEVNLTVESAVLERLDRGRARNAAKKTLPKP